jgi:hypothetical protein
MALTKIGKVTGLEFTDVIHLCNFISSLLRWEEDYFLERSKDKFPWCRNLDCQVTIHPKFILLPKYTYSYLPYYIEELVKKGIIDIDFADKIDPKYFTSYDIYLLEPSEDPCDLVGALEIYMRFSSKESKKIELRTMYTGIIGYEFDENCKKGSTNVSHGDFYLDFGNGQKWTRIIGEDIDNLLTVIGDDYSKYREEKFYSENKISRSAKDIEYTFLNFLNLIYTLYTEGFDKEWFPEYSLFEPIIKTLKEFGDTFEKVIASIRAFSLIMG